MCFDMFYGVYRSNNENVVIVIMNNNTLRRVYSIGYSGFPNVEAFIATLKHFNIDVLIDVRSSPYSLRFEEYNQDKIKMALNKAGIYYRNYAREFGARQENPSFYTDGILDFRKFANSEQFADGIKKIEKTVSSGYVPVLMCAEKEPVTCHRAIMVSKKLEESLSPIDVEHILPDGRTKSKDEIDKELLDTYYPDRDQISLFSDKESDEKKMIEDAYIKQNWKIGYRKENLI